MPQSTHELASLLDGVQGRRAEARAALESLGSSVLDAHMTFHLSESYAMAGDAARALELLEWAVDHGFYTHEFFAKWCVFLVPLRGMPEFDRIIAKAARRVAEFNA